MVIVIARTKTKKEDKIMQKKISSWVGEKAFKYHKLDSPNKSKIPGNCMFPLTNPHFAASLHNVPNLMFGGAIKFVDSQMKYAISQNCSFVFERRNNCPVLPKTFF